MMAISMLVNFQLHYMALIQLLVILAGNLKTKKISAFSFEDQGGLIDAGEDVFDWTHAEGKGNFFYVTSAYTFNKFTAGLDYVRGNIKTSGGVGNPDEKDKVEEFVPRLAYQYNKKVEIQLILFFPNSQKI